MFEDLALDRNFDVFIGPRGDLATVSGRDAFEQEVIVRITEKYTDLIGSIDRENIPSLVNVEAKRVADEMDRLESVAAFRSSFSETDTNTLEVRIIYDTGDEFAFEVN